MTRLERYALRPQSLWWFTFLLSIVIAGWTGSTRAQPVADRHQAGHSHGAHSHGKAEMELTIQGSAIRGLFRTPMDSLLGFEHAPKTDAQKKAVSDLRERLKNPALWFVPTADAQCVVRSHEASSTLFSGAVKDAHSDLEYRFSFECAVPNALKGLEILALRDFRRLSEVRVQLVTDRGQRLVKMHKKSLDLAF